MDYFKRNFKKKNSIITITNKYKISIFISFLKFVEQSGDLWGKMCNFEPSFLLIMYACDL
ncbi:hypothetical protein CIK91_04510 [Segatella bryantii]|uniref:Uncharacterized protein n=1 Tax=Segatella bryantii TaxID=77095 RepID=A0ABX4EHM6_SEGBR|nr:hypothetical protein CIK91_04510 [Segatella bryantii]